jgi:hypothetical protein
MTSLHSNVMPRPNIFARQDFAFILTLLVVWIVLAIFLAWRIDRYGAFASHSVEQGLHYYNVLDARVRPDMVRLSKSYKDWALNLYLSDPSQYTRIGLAWADGQGIALKDISPEHPDRNTATPFWWQAPGTGFVIGLFIKIFGQRDIWPYFIFVCCLHFFCAIAAYALACQYVDKKFAAVAGCLSLLALPVLDYTFGIGIFSADVLAALPIGVAFIVAARFWNSLDRTAISTTILQAVTFGALFGIASYFKDGHAVLGFWTLGCLIAGGFIKKKGMRKILTFVGIAALVVLLIQLPWRMRNQAKFGEFAMCQSTLHGYALWAQLWGDPKEYDQWCWNGGTCLGSYLAPELAPQLRKELVINWKRGSSEAMHAYVQAIIKHPIRALRFKLRTYPTLWLGQKVHPHIYLWCLISLAAFFCFALRFKLSVGPVLYAFPSLMLFSFPLLHYEQRYTFLFFQFVTPVACALLLQSWVQALSRQLKNEAAVLDRQNEEEPDHMQTAAGTTKQ